MKKPDITSWIYSSLKGKTYLSELTDGSIPGTKTLYHEQNIVTDEWIKPSLIFMYTFILIFRKHPQTVAGSENVSFNLAIFSR